MTHKKMNPMLAVGAGLLMTLFTLAGCGVGGNPADNIPLPKEGTPGRKSLNEICLKVLPANEAEALKSANQHVYPSDFSMRDKMLRKCIDQLTKNQNPIPQ